MTLIKKYLEIIQSEYGYENPIQTRPKPIGGIIKNKNASKQDSDYVPGIFGPTGSEVDLDQDDSEELMQHVFSYKFNDKNKNQEKSD